MMPCMIEMDPMNQTGMIGPMMIGPMMMAPMNQTDMIVIQNK